MQPVTDADPLGGLKELYFKQLKERLRVRPAHALQAYVLRLGCVCAPW
jgi:hypothetical protein